MFGHGKRIKELENQVEALKNLSAQLTANSIGMIKEYQTMSLLVSMLAEKQEEIDKIISPANDDNIIN